MEQFNLLPSDIIDLELKLDGKLPIDRNELLALVNSWGRDDWFFTKDKDNKEVLINDCKANKKYDLSKLDVSKISNFNEIFKESYFEGDINSWDISNAKSMVYMFANTKKFNSPLDNWDTLNVTSMSFMFANSKKFNSSLDTWNVSKVISMFSMFAFAKEFNQHLDKWNTSKVEDMSFMFYKTKEFNQNINSWDITNVTNMDYMFEDAKAFNQPILVDLSKVDSCIGMFLDAKAFKEKFNNGQSLSNETNKIKEWLIKNRDRMIAIEIENSKGKELDNFLLNFNNNGIYNGNI